TGIEIGLASNDKKNKSGKYMENKIETILNQFKLESVDKQVKYSSLLTIEEQIKNEKNKVFDFVFKYNDITYCVETNFFNGGGSKINSEADRFIALNKYIKNNTNMRFI